MRALEEPVQRGARFAQTTSIPAPVKGWNTIDPLAKMDPQYAVQLDNWIPQPGYCQIRGGSQDWSSGLPSPAMSFIPFLNGLNSRLFAAAASGFYDVTSQMIVGAPAIAINSADNWVSQAFETLAGPYVTCCNGADPVLYYDGTTWLPSPIAGVDPTLLCGVTAYQSRLWFVEKDSLSAWYLAPGAITGAATEFELGQQTQRGGRLVACGTWSLDAGNGPSEYIIFVTDQGEIIVYQGTDPSSGATFGKVGTYRVPKPIGRKCLLAFAGDMLLLTQQGVYPLSKALLSSTLDRSQAITYTISSRFIADYALAPASTSWDMTLFTEANLLLVNVPLSAPDGTSSQYVMNTLTGAWSRFLGFDASAWIDFNGRLFYASQTPRYDILGTNSGHVLNIGGGITLRVRPVGYTIEQALVGNSDRGLAIPAAILTAYSYFDQNPVGQKQIKLVRPTFQTTDSISLFMAISTDFRPLADADYMEIDFEIALSTGGARWDVSLWDVGIWQSSFFAPLQWCSPVAPVGFCAAIGTKTQTNGTSILLSSFDIAYEAGQGIL